MPVVVANRPGAAGNIGAAAAAKAAPDGYTLLVAATAISAAPGLYKEPGFRLFDNLTPVTLIGTIPYMLIVHPSLPAHTVAEFIDYARKHPGKLALGSAGNGSIPHLAGEILRTRAQIDFVHVPYKGTSQAIVDLVSGQVQFTIDGGAAIVPLLETGKMRLLAVTGPQRLSQFPSTPTLAESGFPGFDASGWLMVLVPAGTPKLLIEKLHAEIGRALRATDMEQRLKKFRHSVRAGFDVGRRRVSSRGSEKVDGCRARLRHQA